MNKIIIGYPLIIDAMEKNRRNICIIKKVVDYSYELLMEKMRIVNNLAMEDKKLSINNEDSMKLELGITLKTIGHLYEFTPEERFIVQLEKKEKIKGSLKSNKNKGQTCDVRMDVYVEYGGVKTAIELKFLKKENGAEPNNRFGVYADLYNLELYRKEGYDLCYFILVTDNDRYMNATIKGKAEKFILKDKFIYRGGTELEYEKKYNGSFSLQNDYHFIWNKDSSNLYFLKLELPKQ